MAQPVVTDLFGPSVALRQTAGSGHGNPSGVCQFCVSDANDVGICHNDNLADWRVASGLSWFRSPLVQPKPGLFPAAQALNPGFGSNQIRRIASSVLTGLFFSSQVWDSGSSSVG